MEEDQKFLTVILISHILEDSKMRWPNLPEPRQSRGFYVCN